MFIRISLLIICVLFTFTNHALSQLPVKQLKIEEINDICILEPSFEHANFHVKAPERLRLKSARSATFEVDYINTWAPEAKAAFEYALDIWSTYIKSDIPIRIEANWIHMDSENTLASAGPTYIYQIDEGEPNTWYSSALASAITGYDLVTHYDAGHDIVVNVNARFSNWHFDPSTKPSGVKFDFVTVILHEIGHGLGFTGSMQSSGATSTEWGYDGDPSIYDRYIFDGDFINILDQGKYSTSSALYDAITGKEKGLYFWADYSSANNDGAPVTIYAPPTWSAGSSYSHVDQMRYTNSENALMRPQVDYDYSIHSPGPLVCGMFKDMGWPMGAACEDLLTVDLEPGEIAIDFSEMDLGITNAREINTERLRITNEDASGNLTGHVKLRRGKEFKLNAQTQFFNIKPNRNNLVYITYNPMAEGRHEDVLEIYHNDPAKDNPIEIPLKGEALEEDQVVLLEQNYPNPFSASTTIPYAIPQESKVRLDVYDILGKRVMTVVDSQQPAGRYFPSLNSNMLSNGLYIYVINVDGVLKSGKLFVVK